MDSVLDFLKSFIGTGVTVLIIAVSYILVKKFVAAKYKDNAKNNIYKQLIFFALGVIALIMLVSAFPMQDQLKGQIISLIGIILSATIALSSTTMMGNILAGIMNKVVGSYEIGDFIKVDSHFGRVTSTGIFHTEIQTAERDLLTIPNLFLATNPVEVTRNSGTIVSATVSLSYDVSRVKIEKALLKASEQADLTDSFVFVTELGDYSIVYKVHGLLKDTKRLISVKSSLQKSMLDELHKAEIEIVSPTFMNQRQVDKAIFIPKVNNGALKTENDKSSDPESIIFDKASKAENIENKRERIEELEEQIKFIKEEMKGKDDLTVYEKRLERIQSFIGKLQENIDAEQKKIDKDQ